MTRVRTRIARALTQRDHVPDFRDQDIPPREDNASLHDRLTELMAQRNATENDIMDMLNDRRADGTPLNPKRDYEQAYHAASARHNQHNRDMWHAYTLSQEPQAPIYRAPARRPHAHQESSSAASAPAAIQPRSRGTRKQQGNVNRTPTTGQTGPEFRRDKEKEFYDDLPL